jgi:hypothetical protein
VRLPVSVEERVVDDRKVREELLHVGSGVNRNVGAVPKTASIICVAR